MSKVIPDEFSFRWEIDNATATLATGKAESGVFNEKGFKWSAAVEKKAGNKADFTLRCDVDHNPAWKCALLREFRRERQGGGRAEGCRLRGISRSSPLHLLRNGRDYGSHILKLADQFQMKNILELAKKHLTQTQGIGTLKKLLLADRYCIAALRDQCLVMFTNGADMARTLKSSPEYADFSADLKVVLCD